MPQLRSSLEHHPCWAALLQAQHGVVEVTQLADLGATTELIAAHVAAKRWQQPLPRVYVTFTGPLPRPSRIAAALCYGGPPAILSHRTAAEEWGMLPADAGPIHITMPYTSSAVHQPGVRVHRSRAYEHILVAADPPRTSRADTAIDVAVEEPTARQARVALTQLLTGGRVRPLEVERRLQERPPRRYRRALAGALRLVREGVQSVLEEMYAVDVEEAHGLPKGHRQAPHIVDGVTLFEDVVYDAAGFELTVRHDGRTHLIADVAFRDRRRDNAAELAGRSRLVFGWRDLAADPCAGADDVAQVLRRRGWSGQLRRCSRCPVPRES